MMNTIKKIIKIPKISKQDPSKSKKLKKLFEIEPDASITDTKNKIQIKYNETVFFNRSNINDKDEVLCDTERNSSSKKLSEDKELSRIIHQVINSANTNKENRNTESSSIKLNFNINNNYYNSNYNYIVNENDRKEQLKQVENVNDRKEQVKQEDNKTGIAKFFKKVFNKVSENSREDILNQNGKRNSIIENGARPRSSVNEDVNWTRHTVNQRSSSASLVNSETNGKRTSENQRTSNFIFVPCINCNNLIHIEEIENHSNYCTRVKEEVIFAESSQFSYHTIDFKLRKLQEHINIMKISDGSILLTNSNSLSNITLFDSQKDGSYISMLLQYISDSVNVCKIDSKAISDLKKILTNIDTLIHTYKGTMSTLVLIERTRVLINEKIMIFREDFKKNINTKKLNERKSGALNSVKIQQLEKEKEEKTILAEKLGLEKEMMLRKVTNLKKSPIINHKRSSVSPPPNLSLKNKVDFKKNLEIDQEDEEEEEKEEEKDELNRIDAKKIYNKRNVIDNIDSDLENNSMKSGEYSDCTSMTSSASVTSGNMDGLGNSNGFGTGFRNSDPLMTGLSGLISPVNKDSGKSIYSFPYGASNNGDHLPNSKKLYQEFLKIMLQVKFEKIHNTHKGQQISEKLLFRECIKQNIPQQNWADFIIKEFKQPSKYTRYYKRDNKLNNYKPYINNMEIINEEI